ncbi:hypothetical protein H5410_002299, partial [Solanum commersonii]
GDTEWTYHYSLNPGDFAAWGCNNPLYFKNNTIYLVGDKAAQRPSRKFYGRHFPSSKQRSIQKAYTEDVHNGGMLVLFLSREERDVEVWRYKLKSVGEGTTNKLVNKIYFPMFHDNNKVFSIVWPIANHTLSSKLTQVIWKHKASKKTQLHRDLVGNFVEIFFEFKTKINLKGIHNRRCR